MKSRVTTPPSPRSTRSRTTSKIRPSKGLVDSITGSDLHSSTRSAPVPSGALRLTGRSAGVRGTRGGHRGVVVVPGHLVGVTLDPAGVGGGAVALHLDEALA